MRPQIREALVVEGRYDKNTLSQTVDALIIETEGFGVFSNKEKLALIRRVASKRGVIILTDSDGAGFLIRNHLKGALDAGQVKHAYIPDIYGREKRKRTASKEGKLGVEGMEPSTLLAALRRAGATFEDGESGEERREPITKADLYELGLTGGTCSRERRARLLAALELPERLTTNGLLDVLNALMTREEFFDITF